MAYAKETITTTVLRECISRAIVELDLEQDKENSKVFVIDDLEKLANKIVDKLDEYSVVQTFDNSQITICDEELVEMICSAYKKGGEY
jgi:hypothetical protein